jgi:hypothetical protein
MGAKATHPPSANAGLIATPSSVTCRSVHFAAYRGGLSEGGVHLLPVDSVGAGDL